MEKESINQLIAAKRFPEDTVNAELIETHISWVIVCDDFVYKIKKPVKYSFLDFSTLEKRKFYCEREIVLNKRITNNVYMHVVPLKKNVSGCFIGAIEGDIVDYAVKMRKLPAERKMDRLLLRNNVSTTDIKNLAVKISNFHHQASIICNEDISNVQQLFNDILTQKDFLETHLSCSNLIAYAVSLSNKYLETNNSLMKKRIANGFTKDCHGDLHSRNIFLLPEPVPFDCIEFNDALRHIDVLDEIAFLCMDLDAFGRIDLSDLFFYEYNNLSEVAKTKEEQTLFSYYKAYRANIRAKVNALRAKDATSESDRKRALDEAKKYLLIMNNYITKIENS